MRADRPLVSFEGDRHAQSDDNYAANVSLLWVRGRRQESKEECAIAVLEVRSLRCRVASRSNAVDPRWQPCGPMIATKSPTAGEKQEILRNLYELIEALDRRVPRLERVGEADIAREAAELRQRAVSLIFRIEAGAPKE